MIITETAPQHKTAIRKEGKEWLAVNGTVTRHPTREAALMAALQNDHPDLAQRVSDLARLHNNSRTITGQLLKAAALLTKGQVFGDGLVASQSRGPDFYHKVKFEGMPAKYHCSCEARISDAHLGKLCAHSLAQHLAHLTRAELAKVIPFNGEPIVIE